MTKDPNTQSITVKKNTVARLAMHKHYGQSWDGVINELLDEVEKALQPKTES